MRFQADHDLHLHSTLSSCSSDPKQSTEAILAYGEANGLTTLCLTDHYWDETVEGASDWYRPQGFKHILASKPLPQEKNCRFLFGCETEIGPAITDVTLRSYRIAKEAGCRFYLGSDAHHPEALAKAPRRFVAAIDALGLTEEDKFRL